MSADRPARMDETGGGGGITNAAGANVLAKSDGTNLVASSIVDTGSAITVGTASGTPQAYTHTLAADGTGTNIPGSTATLLPGVGTGTGTLSRLLLGGPVLGSTGSAAQTTATPVSIGGEVKADGTESFVNVTGTLPSAPSGGSSAVRINATGAGNLAQPQDGLTVNLLAGNTSSNRNAAVAGINASAGVGMNPFANVGNIGVFGQSTSTTAGTNTGVLGTAAATGGTSYGLYGYAWGAGSTNNVGVFGSAANGGTLNVGVFASLGNVTLASAALLADNHTSTAPIAIFRDNGTAKVTIKDGGTLNITTAVHADNTAALAGGLVAGDVYRTSTGVLMVTY